MLLFDAPQPFKSIFTRVPLYLFYSNPIQPSIYLPLLRNPSFRLVLRVRFQSTLTLLSASSIKTSSLVYHSSNV